MKADLLATKLHRPARPAQWVDRPYLSRRLDEGLVQQRQVILVSAPAGFGKTTCITAWIDGLTGWPTTWLSLDVADDDPGRFLAYFVAALQHIDSRLGKEVEGVLRSGQLPPAAVVGARLSSDMAALDGRFLLVLDDFHLIQDAYILGVIDNLLAHLPPSLYLALVTREDPPLPMARLRASNRLTEIRAHDLRFTDDDTNRFFKEVAGLALTPAETAALEAKTEGWAVGLQLAAVAMQRPLGGSTLAEQTSPGQFIDALRGSHRFILSYLTEQVLDRQTEAIRRFLLQTSILDRLNGDLCNAVTGRTDSHNLLERLFGANLFLVPLDGIGQWYRYHHLFADLLRTQQETQHAKESATLHRRASRWYAQAGDGNAYVSEAIRHALAAADYDAAMGLVEHNAMKMIMQGYAKTVHGWVEAIPPAPSWHRPRTDLSFAWMHLLRGAYAEAPPYLERAGALFAGEENGSATTVEDRSLKAEWLVMRSLLLLMEEKAAESMALAQEALALAPEEDGRVRSLSYWAVGSVHQFLEADAAATAHFQKAIQYARVAENPVAEMMAVSGLAQKELEKGNLHLSFEIAAEAIRRMERSGILLPISAVAYGALAQVHYEWAEREAARRQGKRAVELATLGGFNSGIAFSRVFLSRLFQLEGNLESAAREIEKGVDLVQGDVPDYVRQDVIAQQVRVYLAQDRLAAAWLALQAEGFSFQRQFTFSGLHDKQRMTHSLGVLYNSSLRVLLYQARSRGDVTALAPGIELADRLISSARRAHYLLVELEALLLRAQLRAASGSANELPAASVADYHRALAAAAPEGFIGVFLDQGPALAAALTRLREQKRLRSVDAAHVARILAAFAGLPTSPGPPAPESKPAAAQAEAMVEPLTGRELEVLGLMAKGMTYKEIAAALVISLNTVRFHVKAIYSKFQVNKRTQALERARERGIL